MRVTRLGEDLVLPSAMEGFAVTTVYGSGHELWTHIPTGSWLAGSSEGSGAGRERRPALSRVMGSD